MSSCRWNSQNKCIFTIISQAFTAFSQGKVSQKWKQFEKVKRTSCGIIHAVDDPRVGISLALITEPKFVTQDFDFTTLHFSQDLGIASENKFQKNLENAESRYHRFGDQNIRTRRHKSSRWCCRRFRRLRILHNFFSQLSITNLWRCQQLWNYQ